MADLVVTHDSEVDAEICYFAVVCPETRSVRELGLGNKIAAELLAEGYTSREGKRHIPKMYHDESELYDGPH